MYAASVKWRGEFGVDTILEDFHFHERDAFISLYPQGYHKTDKSVGSLLPPDISVLRMHPKVTDTHNDLHLARQCLMMPICAPLLSDSRIEGGASALQGRPIFIQHLGAINYKKMSEITTEDRMIRFHVQEYERCARCIMPACSIVAGRHIDQTFAIIDVKGECCITESQA